jgi:hypothetical protein
VKRNKVQGEMTKNAKDVQVHSSRVDRESVDNWTAEERRSNRPKPEVNSEVDKGFKNKSDGSLTTAPSPKTHPESALDTSGGGVLGVWEFGQEERELRRESAKVA